MLLYIVIYLVTVYLVYHQMEISILGSPKLYTKYVHKSTLKIMKLFW